MKFPHPSILKRTDGDKMEHKEGSYPVMDQSIALLIPRGQMAKWSVDEIYCRIDSSDRSINGQLLVINLERMF
ncbi:hypothetical protein JTE90_012777 [Oedothorax gibbosus]|uniref:Uncharacterized protein n=1 Tax=Oedothorax gibbosus TaxID=931172 RepID=A0AAV6W0J7_9ARAC|nr:hypothetical protein JTE90_012777 [Oedothorax gibbosus]